MISHAEHLHLLQGKFISPFSSLCPTCPSRAARTSRNNLCQAPSLASSQQGKPGQQPLLIYSPKRQSPARKDLAMTPAPWTSRSSSPLKAFVQEWLTLPRERVVYRPARLDSSSEVRGQTCSHRARGKFPKSLSLGKRTKSRTGQH